MSVFFFALMFVQINDLELAERSYDSGQFAEAAQIFERFAAKPGRSRVYAAAKRGNCAYYMEDYALAKLWYLRAENYGGDQDDLQANIDLCDRRLGLQPFENQSLSGRIDEFVWQQPRLAAALAFGCVFAAAFLLLSLHRRWIRVTAALFLCLIIPSVLSAGARLDANTRTRAIVLSPEVDVRAEPTLEGPRIARLEQGETVYVLRQSPRFALVRTHEKDGWIPAHSVQRVR